MHFYKQRGRGRRELIGIDKILGNGVIVRVVDNDLLADRQTVSTALCELLLGQCVVNGGEECIARFGVGHQQLGVDLIRVVVFHVAALRGKRIGEVGDHAVDKARNVSLPCGQILLVVKAVRLQLHLVIDRALFGVVDVVCFI